MREPSARSQVRQPVAWRRRQAAEHGVREAEHVDDSGGTRSDGMIVVEPERDEHRVAHDQAGADDRPARPASGGRRPRRARAARGNGERHIAPIRSKRLEVALRPAGALAQQRPQRAGRPAARRRRAPPARLPAGREQPQPEILILGQPVAPRAAPSAMSSSAARRLNWPLPPMPAVPGVVAARLVDACRRPRTRCPACASGSPCGCRCARAPARRRPRDREVPGDVARRRRRDASVGVHDHDDHAVADRRRGAARRCGGRRR